MRVAAVMCARDTDGRSRVMHIESHSGRCSRRDCVAWNGGGDPTDWFPILCGTKTRPAATDDRWWRTDAAYYELLDRATAVGARLLDTGCGTARRLLAYLLRRDATAILVERDARLLACAMQAVGDLGLTTRAAGHLMDFRCLWHRRPWLLVDVVTHHGVLEHYEPYAIRTILRGQLHVADSVVFAVPIDTGANRLNLLPVPRRHLWTVDEWVCLLNGFRVRHIEVVHSDKDELLVWLQGLPAEVRHMKRGGTDAAVALRSDRAALDGRLYAPAARTLASSVP